MGRIQALLAIASGLMIGVQMASAKTYHDPISRELSFDVPGIKLTGTFESPSGTGKFPAVLLLPGSGPTDRDGNSALGITTDLLKQIADNLAQHGIASYRFDKRAIRRYSASWPKSTEDINKFFAWSYFVSDAKAALAVLASQPEVDSHRVGLIGHSEGSLISLQLGADLNADPLRPKAMVLLSCTGRSMGVILHEQIARALKKQGASAETSKPFLDYTDSACKALAAGQPLPPDTPPGLAALFNPASLDIMGSYCRIDPTDLAKRYTGPVLAINGQLDSQVSAERDTTRLVAALASRKEGSVKSYIAPNASHNLKTATVGNEDTFAGPIVPDVLPKLISFLKENL